METLFSQVLNMSMTASVVIVLVILVRLLLKGAPKIYSYGLWAVVLFRLLCPVSFSSPVSVLEVTAPRVSQTENVSVVYYEVVEQAIADSGFLGSHVQQEPVSVAQLQETPEDVTPIEIGSYVWMAGMALMAVYSLANYLKLKRQLAEAVHWRGEVYLADHIMTPFVLGVMIPRIYLPSDMTVTERRYIIAHERQHIKRWDPLWKLLGYSALCLHWFNPLVWAAFSLAGKDMEMSCDEAVIKRLGPQIRADYAASLLRLATGRKVFSGMPLAFGEGDTKGRVKNMAKWRRPKVWVSILCVIVCIAIVLVCALNPREEQSLEEMTHWEGPSSCAVGDLNYYLPEGCSQESVELMELNDWELKKVLEEKKGLYPFGVVFKEGENTVGGINSYYLPESFTPANYNWIKDLGLWEFEDETLGYFAGSGRECAWEVEFFSDLPGDAPAQVRREHYFFLSEDMTMTYDLWFDLLTVEKSIYQQILDSCIVGGGRHKPVAATRAFLEFETSLPDGYVLLIEDSDTRYIVSDNTIVGGITAYARPELELKFGNGYPVEEWNLDEWLAAMGYEENKSLAYMGGSSLYGDFERHYTSDVPEGQPITEDWHHTFFIREDYVYDVWFNRLLIGEAASVEILAGISGKMEASQLTEPDREQAAADMAVQSSPEEEAEALERCRSVLEQVQSGSRALRCERSSNYDDGLIEYWIHEGDWMTVQTHSDDSVIAFLYKNGIYYDNAELIDGRIGARDESGNILWKESNQPQSCHIPWLSRYQWNEDAAEYLGTEQHGEEMHIRLRINEPFPGFEYGNPEYDVTMIFDSGQSFLRAELAVNQGHVSQSAFTETETVVSLSEEDVQTRIEQEYHRATQ